MMLKKGDILVFKAAQGNFVDQCIARLTNSKVSHAAMVYSDDSLIEMNANGVGVYGMEVKEGNSVYVLRMLSEPNPELLIKSANAYLDAKAIYNFPSLVILAGLLVYRNMRNDIFDISGKIIKAACYELDQWLLQAAHSTVPALICSQLVYQIYYNCGSDYQIDIKGGIFDLDEDNIEETFLDINLSENPPASTRELAKELLEKLDSPYEEPAETILHTPIHNNTFHKRLITILEKAEIKTDPQSLFIMPSDLLNYSLNLKEVGKCDIVLKD